METIDALIYSPIVPKLPVLTIEFCGYVVTLDPNNDTISWSTGSHQFPICFGRILSITPNRDSYSAVIHCELAEVLMEYVFNPVDFTFHLLEMK